MTAQLLASELNNLIQESKRKNNDLRQAAEKSLEELKAVKLTSEAQAAADLSKRINFANPFIIACGTKNAKFTGIAIVCLQRLIVSRALPRSRLNQVLEALQQATSAGLDVQLKILQALPSLLSNYATDLQGELLVTALNICFILQSSKNAIVNNTSAATLQQLVVSVFDKVVTEDKAGSESPTVGEAPTQEGTVQLRPAALDAYRVFNDLCLLTEGQRPEYLRISSLTQTFGLELIESVLTNHAAIFTSHPEQAHVLRTRVMPFIIAALRGRANFATSVRLVRILYTLLRRHMSILPAESGDAMDILTQLLDQDSATWRRALCMEVFRGIFADAALFRRIFALYDSQQGQKPILKNLTATFVRVSTEKPSVIGLGHQSTIPVANPYGNMGVTPDQAMLEASGVSGFIPSSSVGSDGHNTGISTQWSTMRVPCIDQLDKTEPPVIPDSYLYSLTLACITSLSEGLGKFILPLTVPKETRSRKPSSKPDAGRDSRGEDASSSTARFQLERAASFKKNPLPTNPLMLEDHPLHAEVKICAAFIEECWPAILATCSTFLYAALDSDFYHGLVRAFQKFTHVAGLLQLDIPRDAFLTTLGKNAVPPNVFTACLNAGAQRAPTPTGTAEASNSIFSNARGLLSVDSLASQSGQSNERPRQVSVDAGPATLNTRNLLCLRALLNLGIALGPTLSSSWSIVLETLQQADFVLFTSGKIAGRTPMATKAPDSHADQEANALLSNFSGEIKAVETAASRLFESTVDFPNSAFVEVVTAVCNLVEKRSEPQSEPDSRPHSPPSTRDALKTPRMPHRRQLSSLSTAASSGPNQENQFALTKLGHLASINMERLLSYPPEISGWTSLTAELISTLESSLNTAPVRRRAAETLVRIVMEASTAVASQHEESRGRIQIRLLETLHDALAPLQMEDRQLTVTNHATDIEIHKIILDGLRGILENCGESLVSGWDIVFQIMDTIFVKRAVPSGENGSIKQHAVLIARSVKLIRPSFASLELICSDFLSSLPNSCFLNLVDTLYKFCSQDDELNVALTTVTFFWAISDFLSGRAKSMPLTEDMINEKGDQTLLDLAADANHAGSGAALWMLLLLRLTSVATDQRVELRNSAIQTLLRIISAYGDSLSSEAWLISMRSVIFRLFSSIEDELRQVNSTAVMNKDSDDWKDTASVVIQGVASLFASYLNVLTAHETFTSVWKELLGHFETMLDFRILEVNASTFSAVRDILKQATNKSRAGFTRGTVDLAWELWSRDVPVHKNIMDEKQGDDQHCLLVWVETLLELYRLIEQDLDVDRVRRMLALLREAMQYATPGAYSSDVDYVTTLQGKILEVCKLIRTDIPGVPSAMISQVADFVTLAFTQENQGQHRSTYVAMSKESMSILQSLIINNASETDIYRTDAFSNALSALAKPISLKYSFQVGSKTLPPWKAATTCFLQILDATLPHMRESEIPKANFQNIWNIIVAITNGIVTAECYRAPTGSDVLEDQYFDIISFQKLRELIIPALGAESIPDKTRKAYAEGIFRTSVIHAPAPAESAIIYGSSGGDMVGLSALYQSRKGRTVDPPPATRSKMSYVCLDELFSLLAIRDEPNNRISPKQANGQDKTNGSHGHTDGKASGNNQNQEEGGRASIHEQRVRLARTVAPYLILRCALSLRAYIADQPLRGRMPQPVSQRKELNKILSSLLALRSEPDAIPDTANVDSESRKHLLRLYPLLVSAVQIAGSSGDSEVLGVIKKALDAVGEELGV